MNKYITLAALAITFASCTNNDTPTVDAMTDQPIQVNAGVAELMSRSGMTANALQTLSLTIHNENSDAYSYANVKYVSSGGAFALAADETRKPLWQNSTQEVTVSAWSPYVDGDLSSGYAFSVQADQISDENSAASDFLWVKETVDPDGSQADKKITYNNGALNIALQHAMSKLVINVAKATELESAVTISNVAVKGLENACTLDFSTCTVTAATPSVQKDIQAHAEKQATSGYNATFAAIFPPQNAAFSLMIELSDGRKFLYENTAAVNFQSDYAYTLNLKAGKDKVEVASNGVTAAPWGADSNADMKFESE